MKASERPDLQWQQSFWSSLDHRLAAICSAFPQSEVAIEYHGTVRTGGAGEPPA